MEAKMITGIKINKYGSLYLERNGREWKQQFCRRAGVWEGQLTACGDDCPLFEQINSSELLICEGRKLLAPNNTTPFKDREIIDERKK